MPTAAAIGYGSKYEIEATMGTGDFVEIAEIDNLTPPNEKAAVVDATNFQSPDGNMEFILGLTDPGQVVFNMNFLPGSASEILILTAKRARERRASKITYPGGQIWTFSVLITDYAPAVPAAGKMTASVTGKVTGSVVRG